MEEKIKIELECTKEELEILKNTLEVEIYILKEDIKKSHPCTKIGYDVLDAAKIELKLKRILLSRINKKLLSEIEEQLKVI